MYLSWDKKTITDFSDENINSLYNKGYVFTRESKGSMDQTRSLRINLDKFELSSENKRILRKAEDINLETEIIPYTDYSWKIGKLAKDFYDNKFEKNLFTANKIKEILINKHNFNKLLVYKEKNNIVGYCICIETDNILHYSYPFYDLEYANKNLGMGMMLKAIIYAKENNKNFIYLGSAQRPTDVYKLQFAGLEWFDSEKWQDDLGELKKILKNL